LRSEEALKMAKYTIEESASKAEIVKFLEDLNEKDRHTLQKRFNISI